MTSFDSCDKSSNKMTERYHFKQQQQQRTQNHQLQRCRICFQNGVERDFIKPCLCTGTMAYVHQECLALWRQSSTQAFFRCEQCHSEYKFKCKSKITKITDNPIFVATLSLLVLFGSIAVVAFFISLLLPPPSATMSEGTISQEEFFSNVSKFSYPPHINWRSLEGMKTCPYKNANLLDSKNHQIPHNQTQTITILLQEFMNSHLAEILPAAITITITCPLLLVESTQSNILAHLALLSMLYLATILYYNGLGQEGIAHSFKPRLYNLLIFIVPSFVGLLRYYQLIKEHLSKYTKTCSKVLYSELCNRSPPAPKSISKLNK